MLYGQLLTAWLPDCRNSSSWRGCDIMERIFSLFLLRSVLLQQFICTQKLTAYTKGDFSPIKISIDKFHKFHQEHILMCRFSHVFKDSVSFPPSLFPFFHVLECLLLSFLSSPSTHSSLEFHCQWRITYISFYENCGPVPDHSLALFSVDHPFLFLQIGIHASLLKSYLCICFKSIHLLFCHTHLVKLQRKVSLSLYSSCLNPRN